MSFNNDIIEKVLKFDEFKNDLKDYVSYATNVKLERYIVYSFSKIISKQEYTSVIEKSIVNNESKKKYKHDLFINEKNKGFKIEFKYHFGYDITKKLSKELEKYKSLKCILDKGNKKEISRTWSVSYGSLKDIFIKKCDFFIWVIADRDPNSYLKNIDKDNICVGNDLERKGKQKNNQTIKEVIKIFNNKLNNDIGKFDSRTIEIEIKEPYKTRFYFFIYYFG